MKLFAGEGTVTTNALSYCLFLGHANSALNPIVYCFMTRNFRRSVVEIVCRGSRGLARRRPRRRVSVNSVPLCAFEEAIFHPVA